MKHIHKFETEDQFKLKYNGKEYSKPWVSYTKGRGIDYNDNTDYVSIPLTFEILTNGNVNWHCSETPKTIEYKKNNENWTSITATDNGVNIAVQKGDIVQFRGNNTAYSANASFDLPYNGFEYTTCQFVAKGNIMSLINASSFNLLTAFSASFALAHLFEGCTTLISASKLVLPATTLTNSCYAYMFKGCSNLIAAPKLNAATTLASSCYTYMFESCTRLTDMPELPATTLADKCYSYMFKGCTSLTQTSSLSATTLSTYCYLCMFYGCTSLTQAPELPAITLANRCYSGMFTGCTNLIYVKAMFTTTPSDSYTQTWLENVSSTGTFVKNSEASWNVTGITGVPNGWTIETASAT